MHKQLVLAEQNTQLQFEGGLYHPPLWNEHDSPWFISLRRDDHITDVKISKNFVFIPNSLNLFFYSLVPKGELFSLTRPFCFSSFFKFTCLHHNYLFYMHMFANCLCFFFFLGQPDKAMQETRDTSAEHEFQPGVRSWIPACWQMASQMNPLCCTTPLGAHLDSTCMTWQSKNQGRNVVLQFAKARKENTIC